MKRFTELMMPARKGLIVGAVAMLAATVAQAADAPQAGGEEASGFPISIAGGTTFTTDYVFRGVSNSDNDPAVQGYIELSYDIFYLGIWGSNTDLGINDDLEIDWYGGIRPTWNNFEFDFGVLYYSYPNAGDALSGGDPDYFEIKAAVAYPIHEMVKLGVAGYWSPDYFGETDDSFYLEGNAEVSLPFNITVSGAIGQQWFDDNVNNFEDYLTWNIGASWTFKDTLTFDVRYHDTDLSKAECGANICDERIVGTVSVDFSTQ